MRLLVATETLDRRSGIPSYIEHVIPALLGSGHDVVVSAPVLGPYAATIRALGVPVLEDPAALEGSLDGILAMLAPSALRARAAFPDVPLVSVCHGSWFDIDDPPLLAAPGAIVVLADTARARVAGSAAALAGVPVERMTQPVEILGVPADSVLPQRPRLAVVISHALTSRREAIVGAFHARGIAVEVLGGDRHVDDPLTAVRGADIVVGIGRVIVEAMALGRACLVLDEMGSGVWLDASTHGELEASGFTLGERVGCSPERIGELVDGYRPDLGREARELARRHHSARHHASRLVELVAAAPRPAAGGDPALLRHLADTLLRLHQARGAVRDRDWWLAAAARDRAVAEARSAELEGEVAMLQAELEAMRASRSWAVTAPLRVVAAQARRGPRAPR